MVRLESNADTARDCYAIAMEYTAKQRTEIGLVPSPIGPNRLGLIAPMPIAATIQAGILGQQLRLGAEFSKVPRLLSIKIVNPVAIDVSLPTRPTCRFKRRTRHLKAGRVMSVRMRQQRIDRFGTQFLMPSQLCEKRDQIELVLTR